MTTTDLTKTLADLAETRDYLRRCAHVNKDVGAIWREEEFARYADAVDAAIRLLEKTE